MSCAVSSFLRGLVVLRGLAELGRYAEAAGEEAHVDEMACIGKEICGYKRGMYSQVEDSIMISACVLESNEIDLVSFQNW